MQREGGAGGQEGGGCLGALAAAASICLSPNPPYSISDKAENEYGGDFGKIVDVVRCSVVVNTEPQLFAVAKALDKARQQAEDQEDGKKVRFFVVRLKNRFKYPLFNGYR